MAIWNQALALHKVAIAIKGTELYNHVRATYDKLVEEAKNKSHAAAASSRSDESYTNPSHKLWAEAVNKVTKKGYVLKNTSEYEKAMALFKEAAAAQDAQDPIKMAWKKACMEVGKREIVRKVDDDYGQVREKFDYYLLELKAAPADL